MYGGIRRVRSISGVTTLGLLKWCQTLNIDGLSGPSAKTLALCFTSCTKFPLLTAVSTISAS